jgi:hypothetical protein
VWEEALAEVLGDNERLDKLVERAADKHFEAMIRRRQTRPSHLTTAIREPHGGRSNAQTEPVRSLITFTPELSLFGVKIET